MNANLTQFVCVVGSNAVSGFLSWRLQATNSCDVTLVWKSGFEAVAQYGVTFRYSSNGSQLRERKEWRKRERKKGEEHLQKRLINAKQIKKVRK